MKIMQKIVVLFLLLAFCAGLSAGSDEPAEPSTLEIKKLPFSDAVRVGNLLFLSGNIGVLPGSLELVAGGIAAQTRQTMQNIKATLEKYGSSLEEVVKCTVFMADISEWSEMNKAYIVFFPGTPPARSALGTSGLALGARVEIECIATVAE